VDGATGDLVKAEEGVLRGHIGEEVEGLWALELVVVATIAARKGIGTMSV